MNHKITSKKRGIANVISWNLNALLNSMKEQTESIAFIIG